MLLSTRDPEWLSLAVGRLSTVGYAIVTDVVPADLLSRTPGALLAAHKSIRDEIGKERLARAGELGVVRLPMRYEPLFYEYLEIDPILAVVDAMVSSTCILHLQNGFILPPYCEEAGAAFQLRWHRDFPRWLNGYTASVNALVAVDEFTPDNGATLVVPGTHHKPDFPSEAVLRADAIPAVCPAGSVVFFDSLLVHAAGRNLTAGNRMAINMQFTRSWIKQQIDAVRALGDEALLAQAPRTQQLLGWYTRVVTSLDEYYRPSDQRLYRSGQG